MVLTFNHQIVHHQVTITKLDGWSLRYLNLASHISEWSKDPSTVVGAVLVGSDRRDISIGYNGFPPGVKDTMDRLDNRAVRHKLTQHAERNAIDNAKFDTRGATIYCTMFPCSECAKSIISKGISRAIGLLPTRQPWIDEANTSRGIMNEAGIQTVFVVPE